MVPIAFALPAPATAQASPPDTLRADTVPVYTLAPITVRGRVDDLRGSASTASVGYVGFPDLRLRPLVREGELLETVPGMILTQHSGSGKSNQMFVRGFNLDHGTDFSTRVEGMPVNIPTHAHGQGYTDLNFITPEFVDHIEYSLGNYYAEIGDFSSAGGAHLRLRRAFPRPLVAMGLGEDGFRRIVAAGSAAIGARGTLTGGVETKGFDGPWERPEDLRKLSGMARYGWTGSTTTVSLLALAYDNRWNASDQIPLRAVRSGLLSRYGQIDPTLGGRTSRYSLSASVERSPGDFSQRLEAYAVRYDLDLFSNFTYRLENPAAGDQIRQQDSGRWTMGLNLSHAQGWGDRHAVTVGSQTRLDLADVGLSRTNNRVLVDVVRRDDVTQWSTGLFGEIESRWAPWVRTTLGLRADLHGFDVRSDRAENSGGDEDGILSPKASLTLTPWSGTELYVSGGLGFHSNDARGVVTTVDPATGEPARPVDPLVRSRGAEVGVRATPVGGLRSTMALWTVELDSELLFVGDAGTTEASGASRRTGVTLANFYRLSSQWTTDLDISFTRARFLDADPDADRIPGALENVVAAGLTYEPDGDGLLGAIRLRRFGSYPLIEDDSQRAHANELLNLNVGYRWGAARVTLSVLNLLDERHSDIQYVYASRLAGEPPGGVEDLHFHPAEPRQVRVGLSWGM